MTIKKALPGQRDFNFLQSSVTYSINYIPEQSSCQEIDGQQGR